MRADFPFRNGGLLEELLNAQTAPEKAQDGQSLTSSLIKLLECSRGLQTEDLSQRLEYLLSANHKKEEGVFYTPPLLARRITREAINSCLRQNPDRPAAALKILDPASGSGVFLLEAFQYLLELNNLEDASISAKAELLTGSLFGIDKDPRAAQATRLRLLLKLMDETLDSELVPQVAQRLISNIQSGDTLLDSGYFQNDSFDCVIGNPPYGLSRDEQLSPAENEELKRRYSAFRSGKINKYLAFMARGYQLLQTRGCLSYVVPNAWLGIEGGAKLRELLLREGSLHDIVVYQRPVFAGASVEAVTFQICKGIRRETIRIRTCEDSECAPHFAAREVPVSECLAAPGSVIPLQWSKDKSEIYARVRSVCEPLSAPDSGFIPRIALQAYARGKGSPAQTQEMAKQRLFHHAAKADDTCYPYLQGDDVKRYHINWSGEYLSHGKWLAEPQSMERFSGPRVLLREIVNPAPYLLVAAYCDYPALYNKSVLHILPRNGYGETELQALVAILNSRLASFLIQYAGRKSQRRVFPKIVNGDLKDFLLPRDFPKHAPCLAGLAQQAASAACAGVKTALSGIQEQIDRAVFNAYGLIAVEVAVITRNPLITGTQSETAQGCVSQHL